MVGDHAGRLLAITLVGVLVVPCVRAGDRNREYIPEFNAYHHFSNGTRLFLLADTTKQEGKEAWQNTLGVHLDISSKNARRQWVSLADWSRARTIGLRIGYRQVREWDDERQDTDERRGLVELTFRGVLPYKLGVSNRLGFDLRDLDGSASQRYRYRLTIDREVAAWHIVLVPYVQAEFVYDSRYSDWSRQHYQLGSEVELGKHWRIEPYLAVNKVVQPARSYTDQIGLVAILLGIPPSPELKEINPID